MSSGLLSSPDPKVPNIKAGGNIIADTGTTNIVGSNLEAGENIAILADTGGINITTAQELTNAKTREKKIDVKLTNIFDMAQSATDQLGSGQTSIKLNIATATYDDSKTDAKDVNNISSSLNAKNGSVILDSLDDITITGSNVKATDIISLNSQIGNIDIKNATDSKDLKNEETHGQADVSVTVRNEYVEIATAIENTAQAVEQLKDVKAQYSNYKKEVKSLERKLSQLKEDYKNGVIGVDHEDIGDLEDLVENVKDQEKYQIAAIGAATANLASANLAVAKQVATAAASSGTSGFNVGVALDVEGSTTKTNTSGIISVASNLSSDTILMQTDNTMATHTTIQGSNVTASNLAIDTHNLNVLASQDTYKEEMDNKSINGSIAATLYGVATGPSVSLGLGEQHDNIDSLTNNNSNLNATNMLLNVTNDASFIGATVRADNLDMFVGNDLNVESLRDEYSSNSNGYNISAGISFGSDSDYAGETTAEQNNLNNTVGVRTSSSIAGGNIGGGVNSGSNTSKQVVLTSITANNADITVGGNTNLKGSLIAAGYYDENGNFIDNGNLNLTTNTLTFSNLNSTSYSTNTSVGGGVSLNQNKQGETLPNASSVTYDASSGISYSKEKTLATIGAGNLTITDKENSDDTTKLNRNTDNLSKELYSGGVSSDVSATIDMRMFTEDGREQMAQEYKDMDENMKTIADTLPDAHSDNVLEAIAGKIWDSFTGITGGILPSNANSGGVLGEIPILTGDKDSVHKVLQIVSTNSPRYNEDKDSFIPIEDSIEYKQMSEYQQTKVAGLYISREPVVIDQNTATYQNGGNGILNNEGLATFNVLEQTGLVGQYTNILMQDTPVEATIFYNPTRGIVADLLESAIDTTGVGTTGIAKQAGEFVVDVTTARGVDGSNFTSHSQFNIVTYSGINWINGSEYIGDGFMPTTYFISETEVDINGNPKDGTPTFVSFGSPVNGEDMKKLIANEETGLGYTYMGAFTHSGDYVGEGLGGNSGVNGQASFIDRANILNTLRLFMGSWSPHSSYDPYAYEELRDVVGYKP